MVEKIWKVVLKAMYLNVKPVTQKEIIKLTGYSLIQVNGALKQLKYYGLIKRKITRKKAEYRIPPSWKAYYSIVNRTRAGRLI